MKRIFLLSCLANRSLTGLWMRGILVSEKYRAIESDGIIYYGLAKYHGVLSGGTDFQ